MGWEFKQSNKAGASKMMMGQGKAKDQMLLDETLKAWIKYVKDEKTERELQDELKKAQEAMDRFKSAQSENTKKVMQRMSAGNDAGLKSMCFQGWTKALADMKAENAMA